MQADKQDYLLRDSRFCGVEYGVFDIFQLHRSLVLAGPKDQGHRIKMGIFHKIGKSRHSD